MGVDVPALEVLLVPAVSLRLVVGGRVPEETFLPPVAFPDHGGRKANCVGTGIWVPVDIAVDKFGTFSHSVRISQFVGARQQQETGGPANFVVVFLISPQTSNGAGQ